MMAGIRGRDTKPEVLIRKALHARGFRYRLNVRKLPGTPDLVFPGLRAVIFAHGCFWHKHDCHLFKWPSTRPEFWRNKINGNVERDRTALESLESLGWRTGIVWECAIKGKTRLPFDSVIDHCCEWLSSDDPHLEVAGQ